MKNLKDYEYYRTELGVLYLGDCLEIMGLIDKKIDLIITSPPYEDISGAGYKADKKDILFFKLYSEFLDKLFKQYNKILIENGQIFFNIKSKTHNTKLRTPHWIEFTDGFQLFDFKSYLIWKYAGSFDSTYKRFHLDYEIIYHLSKGDNININKNCDINDFLTSVMYIPHNIKNRLHPTQMPEKVVERLLKITAKKDYTVLDTFAGSGTTLKVCKDFGLKFIGIEINEDYCKIAKERIEKFPNQLELKL